MHLLGHVCLSITPTVDHNIVLSAHMPNGPPLPKYMQYTQKLSLCKDLPGIDPIAVILVYPTKQAFQTHIRDAKKAKCPHNFRLM